MKKNYILSISAVVLFGALSFNRSGNYQIEKFFAKNGHKLNAGGAGSGVTGAPGEGNCTNCHSGTTLAGTTENVLTVIDPMTLTTVTTYIPSKTYSVALTMSSIPSKKGFQATALDPSNAMAGTFAAGTNTSISGTLKKYANHTSTSNTNTTTAWLWSWTAPATDVGNVKFYVATNKANDNNNQTGDQIYLSQHTLTPAGAGIGDDENTAANFKVGYSSDNNTLNFNYNSLVSGETSINIVDLNGRSVFASNLGNAVVGKNVESFKLPAEFKNGMYIANFFVNNNAMSAKFMVQR